MPHARDGLETPPLLCEARAVTDPPVPALPPRPPRSLAVHWLVDAAVAFLAVVVVALFWGLPVVLVALVALGLGAVAAPFTRRAEIRSLAARTAPDDSGGPDNSDDSGPATG